MYQIGDYVVKTVNGVCEVKDIINPDFVDDPEKKYYQLMPLADQNARLYVPIDKVDDSMRGVMTEQEANNLIQNIPNIHEAWVLNEKERERSYKTAIQSNDPEKLVGIIKLIYQRKTLRQKQGKRTTAVDGRYFEMAEKLLYSELELVLKRKKDEIDELIKVYCSQSDEE